MYTPAVIKALVIDLHTALTNKEFGVDCILEDTMREYLRRLQMYKLPVNEHIDKLIGKETRANLIKALCLINDPKSEFYQLVIPSIKIYRVLSMTEKRYCAICGRQIVSYEIDDKLSIGPGRNCLRMVKGWACPPCSEEERALVAAGYY